jgi:hypothetical protein
VAVDDEGIRVNSILIIDGFALIQGGILHGEERASWWKPESYGRIISVVGSFDDCDFSRIWLVFEGPYGTSPVHDGADPSTKKSRLEVFHVPQADEWITARVRGGSSAVSFTVVTADEDLKFHLERLGAKILTPEAFLSRCRAPVGKKKEKA